MLNDLFIFKASYLDVDIHSHHSVQIVVSLDHVFNSVIDNNKVEEISGFIVDSNIPHACKTSHCTVLVINVNPQSETGRTLKMCFKGIQSFQLLSSIIKPTILASFVADYNDDKKDIEHFVQQLFPVHTKPAELDRRITESIRFIEENASEKKVSLHKVAAQIHLSGERFRHLFKEQTGISVSKYILWTKLRVALYNIIEHKEMLMSAAVFAGFADGAHLSRTFRTMFGIPMTVFLKNSRFIQLEQFNTS